MRDDGCRDGSSHMSVSTEISLLETRPSRPVFHPAVYWYLSLRCNLACKHCWVNSSPKVDTSGDLQPVELLEAVRNIKKLDPSGVILTGGEPLFHPSITLILEELIRQEINTFIETNAMLVTEEILALAQAGLGHGMTVHYAVSLDGGTKESHDWLRGRGSFDSTVQGLRRLRTAEIPADIQCVVNRRNWHTLPNLVDLAQELDVTYLKFVLANPVGRANRFLKDLIVSFDEVSAALSLIDQAIRTYTGTVLLKVPPAMIPPALQERFRGLVTGGGCAVQNVTSCGFPLLGVLPDGSVTICAATREHGEAYFGNIRDISLDDVWRAQQLDRRRLRYLNAELRGICADCVFKLECRGGCRAHAFMETGSFEGPYPICAEMERQGYFPDVYRLSHLQRLKERLRVMRTASGDENGDR